MATAQDIIDFALRFCTTTRPGQTPHSANRAEGLVFLNDMLSLWSTQNLLVPYLIQENFTLVVGTTNYTIGTGATWDTPRPLEIRSAFLRDTDGLDYPMKPISREVYNSILDKTVQGRPYMFWYDNQYAEGEVNLYYAPEEVEDIYISSIKPLVRFAALGDTVTLPPGYELTLKLNLAKLWAPTFAKVLPVEVLNMADESKMALKTRNTRPLVSKLGIPVGRTWLSNIYSGE
jgi:hypothetical protein